MRFSFIGIIGGDAEAGQMANNHIQGISDSQSGVSRGLKLYRSRQDTWMQPFYCAEKVGKNKKILSRFIGQKTPISIQSTT